MLLEKAFSEAQKLDPKDQDALASIIMEEIIAEKKWEHAFSASQDKLEALADEALDEKRQGRTKPLTFE